jgi:hypothetical protein
LMGYFGKAALSGTHITFDTLFRRGQINLFHNKPKRLDLLNILI